MPNTQLPRGSLRALDFLSLFLAALLAGYGPRVALHLAGLGWEPRDIGLVLTAGVASSALTQAAAGDLIDRLRSKRVLVALTAAVVTLGLLCLGLSPNFAFVFAAAALLGASASILGTTMRAISLGVVGYEEGLSDGWNPIRAYWQDASPANREALRDFLKPETTVWQYTHGVPDATLVSPDGYALDNFYLSRPGADEVQLDLFGDYKSNVALYPSFQDYFRTHRPPLLAVWGKNDPFFLPAGAKAFRHDIPGAVVHFFDTGHFALETHAADIAAAIREFLPR